jgi:Uma2 family endonuclease
MLVTTQITAIDFEKVYTIDEFLKLDLPEDADYELIGGKVVARPNSGTSGEHGEIIFKLATFLGSYLLNNPVGKGYSEASCTLGRPAGSNYVKPDVCFVAAGRTPDKFRGPIPVAPDLAIEIWSPSDSTEIIQDKIEAYQQAEVKLIWSIYMLNKYVLVYHLNDPDIKLLNLNDELDGEDVLPGFKLKVSAFLK